MSRYTENLKRRDPEKLAIVRALRDEEFEQAVQEYRRLRAEPPIAEPQYDPSKRNATATYISEKSKYDNAMTARTLRIRAQWQFIESLMDVAPDNSEFEKPAEDKTGAEIELERRAQVEEMLRSLRSTSDGAK